MSRKSRNEKVWLAVFCTVQLALPAYRVEAVPVPRFTPGPNPTHTPELPPVFTMRITDVLRDVMDPENDAFYIELELLNWTDASVSSINLFVNVGSGVGGSDAPPRFANNCGFVDVDGRPIFIGSDNANFPGGESWVAIDNNWHISVCTPERMTFCGGTPLAKRDLVEALKSGGSAAACALVPGCQIDMFGRPVIPDMETIDDTTLPSLNVLDGFVIYVDDFDLGEYFSFSFYLVDGGGNLIGTPAGGNEFGFGTINFFCGVAGPPIVERLATPGLFGSPQNDPRGANEGTSSTSGLMFEDIPHTCINAEEGAAVNLQSVGNDAIAPTNGVLKGSTAGTIQPEVCSLHFQCMPKGGCRYVLTCFEN